MHYDAITLALRLSDRTGLDVLSHIRHQSPSSDSPVVAVTMPAEPRGVVGFQITDVLFKPIEASQIRMALNQIGLSSERGSRVMVVDDDPIALDLMHVTLKTIGLNASCVQDGRQALQELDAHLPDALILDLMMPGFDGFAVLDALRRMPRWRNLPVFIWTSMLLTDEEYALLSRSAHAILSKGGGTLEAVLNDLRRWRPLRQTRAARSRS